MFSMGRYRLSEPQSDPGHIKYLNRQDFCAGGAHNGRCSLAPSLTGQSGHYERAFKI
jgi:hypothetical protein